MSPKNIAHPDQTKPLRKRITSSIFPALEYTKLRWAVFPLEPRDKRPHRELAPRGCHGAVDSPDAVREIWADPTANIGVACGERSGLDVLDVDGEEGAASLAALEAEHGPLPVTFEAETGKGRHIYFLHDPRMRNSARKLGPGLDTRSTGGYVVAPPSVHPSGTKYCWRSGRSPWEVGTPASWPAWAIEAFASPPAERTDRPSLARAVGTVTPYALAALEAEADNVAGAGKGERNHALNRAAFSLGQLVAAGVLDEAGVIADLRSSAVANGLVADDGERSVMKTIRSGLKGGMREPRQLPEPRSARTQPTVAPTEAQEPRWGEPIPIGRDVAPVPFPTDVLPRWMGEFIEAEARAVQVPTDMPALFALGALAAVTGGQLRVQAWGGFVEACNLYACVAMPPASIKSPVHRHMTEPIAEIEERMRAAVAPEIEKATMRRAVLEKRLRRAEDQAAKAPMAELEEMMSEVEEAGAALASENVPPTPRLIVDDTTPEQLKSLLHAHGGRLAMLSAESALFGNFASARYSKAPNIEAVLAAHSGDRILVDRRGRSERIDDPRLTICVAVQPSVLREASQNPMARDRGLFARFLYSIPPSNVGERNFGGMPPQVPPHVREAWGRELLRIGMAFTELEEPLLLHLTHEARQAFQKWRACVEPRRAAAGDLISIIDWAGKMDGTLLRLAGLLHVASANESGEGGEIGAETIARAARLMEYFEAHAKLAYDVMGEDEMAGEERKLLAWIRSRIDRGDEPTFAQNDATRAFSGRLDAEQVAAAVGRLTGKGWLRRERQPTKGRPRTVFHAHPSLSSEVEEGLTSVTSVGFWNREKGSPSLSTDTTGEGPPFPTLEDSTEVTEVSAEDLAELPGYACPTRGSTADRRKWEQLTSRLLATGEQPTLLLAAMAARAQLGLGPKEAA